MAIKDLINKKTGDKLYAEEWNTLAREVLEKQPKLNIIDALDSSSSEDVLSAKQGKILKELIDESNEGVSTLSSTIQSLPIGYFYGTYETDEELEQLIATEQGYAYVGVAPDYIVYVYKPEIGWNATDNKYGIPQLETDLNTKSTVKAPTTKAVADGIDSVNLLEGKNLTTSQKTTARENIGAQEMLSSGDNIKTINNEPVIGPGNITIQDITTPRTSSTELTITQKYNASANINDRPADEITESGVVRALGYKVLNKQLGLSEQISNNPNTIFEIKDKFDLNGALLELPQNCTLKFNGGMLTNGSIKANGVSIDAPNVKIFENITFTTGYQSSGSLNILWLGAKVGINSYDNSVHLQDWYDNYSLVFRTIYFPQGSYYFKSTVNFTENSNKRGLCVDGDNSTFIFNYNNVITTEHTFIYLNTELFTIKNITLRNEEESSTTRAVAIYLDGSGSAGGCQRFTLSNLIISRFDIGVSLFACWYGNFEGRNYITDCRIGCFIREVAGPVSSKNPDAKNFEINNISFLNLIIRKSSSFKTLNLRYNSANRLPELYSSKDLYDSLTKITIGATSYLIGSEVTIDDSKKYAVSSVQSFYLLKKNYNYYYSWEEVDPTEEARELETLPDASEEYENVVVKVSEQYYQCKKLVESYSYEIVYEGKNQRINNIENGTYYPATKYSSTSTITEFSVIYGDETFYFASCITGIDTHCFTGNVKFHGISLEGIDYGLRFNWGAYESSVQDSNARERSIVDIRNCYFEGIAEYAVYVGQGWKTVTSSKLYLYNTYGSISYCHFTGENSIYFRFGKYTWNDNTSQHGVIPPTIILQGDDTYTGYTSLSYNGTPTIETIGKRIIINRIPGTNFNYRKSVSNNTTDNLYLTPKNVLFNTIDNRTVSLPLNEFSSNESGPASSLQQYDSNLISFSSLCGIRHIIYPYPIIDGYIYKPSGNKLVKKPVHSTYSVITQTTDGVPFDVFYEMYWTKGLEFTGKIRNVFPYEITAKPSEGTVKDEKGTIKGFGIKRIRNESDGSVTINGLETSNLPNNSYYIFIDALIAVYRHASFVKQAADLVQCGMIDETVPQVGSLNATTGKYLSITRTNSNLGGRIKQLNGIVFNTTDNKLLIFNGYEWVELSNPWTRYSYVDSGSSMSERMVRAEVDGQTYYNKATGITYTGVFSTNRIDFSWRSSIGNVDSLEHPNGYDASTNPITYETELTAGECVIYNGIIYSWNGTSWFNNPLVRPTENNIPIGFECYDVELKTPIYWDGFAWVDVNNNYIFDNSGTLQNRLALTSPKKGQQFKLIGGENDVYLIYGDYGWLNATDRTPWFDDSGTLNAMYDKYNYILLTSQPDDWPTKYNTYYKIVDGVYTLLTTSETWALDKYYKKDTDSYKGIQVKLTDTDTELFNKVVKWDGTKFINVIDNAALKAGTPIIVFNTENDVTTATITSTSNGKIYYTKDGIDPKSSSTEYSSPITLSSGDQIKAICIRDHVDNSGICFVKVATPSIEFSNTGILSITCDTPDAKIYYTTDGKTPKTTSTKYNSSTEVTIAKGVTVNAFAVLIGRVNSEVATQKRS